MITVCSRRSLAAALSAAAALLATTAPAAFAVRQDPASTAYVALVTEEEVYLRSGNSDGHYPIGKVKRNEMVRVVDEKYEWAQVQTIGPVFARFHGLVKYPQHLSDRLRPAADGKSAVVLGRIDVIAPNPSAKPDESWKMIARLNPGDIIQILETSTTERGDTLHKIALPESGRVWIKKQFLRPAGAAELAVWTRQLAGLPPEDPAKSGQTVAQAAPETIGAADVARRPSADQVLARDTTPVAPPERAPASGDSAPAVTSNQPAEIIMQSGPAPAASSDTTRRASPAAAPSTEAEARLANLEARYAALQSEPIETAEIEPLRDLYLALAEDFRDTRIVQRYAGARAEQLAIWGELQKRRAEMDKIMERLRLTTGEADAIRVAMNSGKDYVAIGRLTASVIYDGRNMPNLLRLQDPGTGRTVAYLQPDQEDLPLAEMVGQLIGIVGTREYDGGLRITLITPTRVDLLSPN